MDQKNRITGLDGLRAISILLVILHHLLFVKTATGYSNKFPGGSYGVTVFFVISGFLITHLLCKEETQYGKVSLGGFYYRRAFRILPPALAYLAITSPYSTHADLLHSVFFVRNFFPGGPVNWHFWSLSVEEQFYLIWPLLFCLLRNNRIRLVTVLPLLVGSQVWRHIGIGIVGYGTTLSLYDRPAHYGVEASLILIVGQYPIMTGCFFALLRREGLLERKIFTNKWPAIAFTLTAVLLVGFGWAIALLPTLVALVINYVSNGETFLDWPPLVWVGKLSYSLYIWQQIFCFESVLGFLGVFPFNLIASFAMASASYYGLEQPSLRIRDWVAGLTRRSVQKLA